MDRCVRIISTSSGVRNTVDAADALTGVGFDLVAGNDCVLAFLIVTISSSFEDERRQSADLMRHMVFRILGNV